MTERSTRQLTAVFEAVKAQRNHPTAHQVYTRVRSEFPHVSRGTVYRNLGKLHRQGRIRVVRLADLPTRYDAVVEEHDHFICEACGDVTDLCQSPNGAAAELGRSGYIVHSQSVTYNGLCPICAERSAR
jgi:Fe2+ or Zn2+ uptake regulation protein